MNHNDIRKAPIILAGGGRMRGKKQYDRELQTQAQLHPHLCVSNKRVMAASPCRGLYSPTLSGLS